MICVTVESPYAGNVNLHREYLRACLRDSLARGEAPFASHALYTQVLDDTVPTERRLGIEAGLTIALRTDLTAVYADLGVSSGMWYGIRAAWSVGRPVEVRYLFGGLDELAPGELAPFSAGDGPRVPLGPIPVL